MDGKTGRSRERFFLVEVAVRIEKNEQRVKKVKHTTKNGDMLKKMGHVDLFIILCGG